MATQAEKLEDELSHVLGEEYEHKPVPGSARRSLFSVTTVWLGFPMIITGALIGATYGLNYVVMTIMAGLLYIAITFVGMRGLHWIGLISVPLFVILGLWVAFESGNAAGWDAVFAYAGKYGAATMSMGVGLAVVIALFIDAGTVSADLNRWAADGKSSLISTFSAFPFASLVAMLVGGIMTAALAAPNANPFGADNMFGYINGKQVAWLSVLAFIFLYCNLGSVWGHFAGGPGASVEDVKYLDSKLKELLA